MFDARWRRSPCQCVKLSQASYLLFEMGAKAEQNMLDLDLMIVEQRLVWLQLLKGVSHVQRRQSLLQKLLVCVVMAGVTGGDISLEAIDDFWKQKDHISFRGHQKNLKYALKGFTI